VLSRKLVLAPSLTLAGQSALAQAVYRIKPIAVPAGCAI